MTLLFVMLIKLIYARPNKGNIHKKVSQDTNYMNKKTFQIDTICIHNSTMKCNILDYIKGRLWQLLCKIYSSYYSRIRLSCIENMTRLELQRRCKLTTVNVQRIMEFLLFTFPNNLHSTSSFMTSHLSASICVPSSKSPLNPITPQASIVCCRKRVFWMGENEICTHLGVFSRE